MCNAIAACIYFERLISTPCFADFDPVLCPYIYSSRAQFRQLVFLTLSFLVLLPPLLGCALAFKL